MALVFVPIGTSGCYGARQEVAAEGEVALVVRLQIIPAASGNEPPVLKVNGEQQTLAPTDDGRMSLNYRLQMPRGPLYPTVAVSLLAEDAATDAVVAERRIDAAYDCRPTNFPVAPDDVHEVNLSFSLVEVAERDPRWSIEAGCSYCLFGKDGRASWCDG